MSIAKNITTFVFDLDDTLYSKSLGICKSGWERLDNVFNSDIKEKFGVGHISYNDYKEHGDELLRQQKDFDWDSFMGYICDVDVSALRPDENLKSALRLLPYKKILFSNGDYRHVDRTLMMLEIEDEFDVKFTCFDSNFYFKPDQRAFNAFLNKTGAVCEECVFFEDSTKNLKVAKELGMMTVLISEQPIEKPEYCDFVFGNITEAIKIFL